MKFLLVVFCFCVSAVLGNLEVQKCSKGALPTYLNIHGCSKAPCTIVNGQELSFDAEFINPKATKTLTAKVIGRVGWITIPYELPEEHRDGCKKLTNAECPLAQNQRVRAAGAVVVQSPVVGITATVEFQLHSDTDMALCFKVPAKIVKNNRKW